MRSNLKEFIMFAKFKKIGVASAVAAAVGASGAAQAVILGEPGHALLVPHVLWDSKVGVNTLIGVTVGNDRELQDSRRTNGKGLPTPFYTWLGRGEASPGCGAKKSTSDAIPSGTGTLHYYFFNNESEHTVDFQGAITCEDFFRIDWGAEAQRRGVVAKVNGKPGYLIISDNAANTGAARSNLALYGAAYLIQGNWQSQAYIPVVPLIDAPDDLVIDEVRYEGGRPGEVNPVTAGMPLASNENQTAVFSLRYFLDPALNGNTRFVIWFDRNSNDRANVDVLVYDADEIAVSSSVPLPNELNVLDLAKGDVPGTIRTASKAIPDFAAEPDKAAVNTGFVVFNVPDSTSDYNRGGFAFSLVGVGGANNLQVQTELAHERGVGRLGFAP
jgi:hypothetical protein